ncbi:MAG: DUF721 domain-containing protein [Myxococcota bacterium]|nr:DUF721 domain-containing protein [Myxococcota bacterium]
MARRRGKRRQGSMVRIADLLDRTYPGRAEDKPLLRTFSWWDRTVSPRIAQAARPIKLSYGTLIVHTKSAAWAQELTFHEQDLLASVQKAVPKVKRLRIRVGPFADPPAPPEKPPPAVVPLNAAELPPRVARELARIGDDALRDAVTKAACMSLGSPAKRPPRRD